MSMEYLIVANTQKGNDKTACLVCTAGMNKKWAETLLGKILANDPDEHIQYYRQGKYDFRIEEEPASNCWWK